MPGKRWKEIHPQKKKRKKSRVTGEKKKKKSRTPASFLPGRAGKKKKEKARLLPPETGGRKKRKGKRHSSFSGKGENALTLGKRKRKESNCSFQACGP